MLTYATTLAYLLRLGERFQPIGRSELSYEGLVQAAEGYPLLVVEGEVQGQDIYREATPTGVESLTFAVQVLTQPSGRQPEPAGLSDLLAQTKEWAEALTEQVRREQPGQLVGVNKVALPGSAGSDLATGWRVELTLKLQNPIDRAASAALFDPA